MNWLLSILIAVLSGALGLFSAGFIMNACVKWYRISSFEGGSGYAVIFTAIGGGIAGLIIGLMAARLVAAGVSPGFLKGLGCAWGAILVLSVVAVALCRLLADVPPTIDGQELNLEVELRLPVGETDSIITTESYLDLNSILNHRQRNSRRGELRPAEAKIVDGRWTIPGSVFLYTGRGQRALGISFDGKTQAGFLVPLPARPGKKFEQWSDWLPRAMSKDQPWPETKMSYRFRVQRIQPPPPEPDPAVVEAEQFATLKPDAPLEKWLSFMNYDSPEERVQAVMKVVEARPAELARLIRATNSTARESALSAVPKLVTITPEISESVIAEGREIAAGVRQFNGMKADEPHFYEVQLELSSRFNFWKLAWWTTHQRLGLDGRPPVQEIYDLALVRAQDTSMDEIVVNARVILEALPPAPAKTP